MVGCLIWVNFCIGMLIVCMMVLMCLVLYWVVCLVGLDDGVFLWLSYFDGDDVLV